MHNVVLGGESAVGENGYLHSLAYYRARITASQKANETLFGISHFDNEFEPYSTYEENYQYLVNWLTWRTEWFDSYYGNTTGSVVDRTSTYNGVNYGLVYDYEYYVSHSDVIRATGSLNPDTVIAYFVEHDMANGVQASLNFNPKTYRSRYSDLDAAFGGDWASYYNHYMTYGFFEDRSAV
jgi:hypothetical protein